MEHCFPGLSTGALTVLIIKRLGGKCARHGHAFKFADDTKVFRHITDGMD